MTNVPFFKKIALPRFSLEFLHRAPDSATGIDIGSYSTKVVELRKEGERVTLKAYGEIINRGRLKGGEGMPGFLRYPDNEVVALISEALKEVGVTVKTAVFSVPVTSSFITAISFPDLSRKEIEQAIPYEARKYIPIPITEVTLDWEIREPHAEGEATEAILVAVPKEVIEKFKRIAQLAGLTLKAIEVESFSDSRSLAEHNPLPVAVINLGHQVTALTIIEEGVVRAASHLSHGAAELTRALEGGLGVTRDRAEVTKREIGLSERAEEREISSILAPLLEVLFSEIEKALAIYNRRATKKIQRILLTGGGSNLKGLVNYTSIRLGLEVGRGNPFGRVATPTVLQPVLREIGPTFSVATGLALRELTNTA